MRARVIRLARCPAAILDRYPDDVTRELRDILARQAMTSYDGRFPAIGRY